MKRKNGEREGKGEDREKGEGGRERQRESRERLVKRQLNLFIDCIMGRPRQMSKFDKVYFDGPSFLFCDLLFSHGNLTIFTLSFSVPKLPSGTAVH